VTGFVLKMIALLTMTIDHAGAVMGAVGMWDLLVIPTPFGDVAFTTMTMRMIGRMAFPIYAFLVAEGCRKTRSPVRYVMRLLAFAMISEIPFNLMVGLDRVIGGTPLDVFDFGAQNVFFTLAAGAAACFLYERFKERSAYAGMASALCMMIAAKIFWTDYDFLGVAAIFAAFMARNTKERAVAVTAVLGGALYFVQYVGYDAKLALIFTAFAALSGVLMFFYNGKPGPRPAWLKWGFYAYYPLHISVLAAWGIAYLTAEGRMIWAEGLMRILPL